MILRDSITVLRPSRSSDGYGNQTSDWTSPTSTDYLVKWSAKATSEVVGDEPRTSTRGYVFGGPDLDLESTDRVVGPDGLTYEVDGDVMQSFLRGQLHHLRAYLRRITTEA